MEGASNLLAGLDEDDLHVLNRLSSEGGTWIVGGWVRDALASVPGADVDIATSLSPDQVVGLFPDSLTHGARFGTICVRTPNSNRTWEVTSLRTEAGYTDGRRPDVVEFGEDIIEDLSRRDFTVNSMAIAFPSGDFLDPFEGMADLGSRVIRTVGDPSKRFSEDGLRILRAYRFIASPGGWLLDKGTESAIRDCIGMISSVSAERIGSEFRRMINLESGGESLRLMRDHGLLEKILPGAHLIEGLCPTSDLAVAMALMYKESSVDAVVASETIKSNLKATKEEVSIFGLLMTLHPSTSLTSAEEVRRFHVYVPPDWKDSVIAYLDWFGVDGMEVLREVPPPRAGTAPLVDGNTLSQYTGIEPGVRLGRLKGHLHRLQIERDLTHQNEVLGLLGEIDLASEDHFGWKSLSWP